VHGQVKKAVDKKDGAGTHGAWSKAGVDDLREGGAPVDARDPLFDADEAAAGKKKKRGRGKTREDAGIVFGEGVPVEANRVEAAAKAAALAIVEELLDEGDVDGAVAAVRAQPDLPPGEIVKRALIAGVEGHARDRELVSRCLSALHAPLEGRGYTEGFQALLTRLPDLVVDVRDAADYVGLFVARCLYDDVLPPAFLKEARVESEPAKQALALAYSAYHDPIERARLEHVWGASTALASVDELEHAADELLNEYLDSLELGEATKALQELGAPSFHAQVIKAAVLKAIEAGEARAEPRQRILALLSAWQKQGVVSDTALRRGLQWARDALPELRTDVPLAGEAMTRFEAEAKALGLPLPVPLT